MFPIFYMPEKDEDFYYYIQRLLNDNGIFHIPSFIHKITNKPVFSDIKDNYPFGLLLNMFKADENIVDIILETTNYDLEAIFMSESEQAFYLQKMFIVPKHVKRYLFNYSHIVMFNCPKCRDEFHNGKSYIKKIHRNNFYHACPYHGFNFSNPLLSDANIHEARYIKKLQDNKLDLCFENLIAILGNPRLKTKPSKDMLICYIRKEFHKPEDFVKWLPKETVNIVEDKEYMILSKPRNNITAFKHIPCGYVFCMNVAGFNAGLRCPNCADSILKLNEINKLIIDYKYSYLKRRT